MGLHKNLLSVTMNYFDGKMNERSNKIMEFHLIYVSFGVECFVRLGEDKRNLFKFYDYDSFPSMPSRTKTNPFLVSITNGSSFRSFDSVPIPFQPWITDWLFKFHLKVIQPFISFLFALALFDNSQHIFYVLWAREVFVIYVTLSRENNFSTAYVSDFHNFWTHPHKSWINKLKRKLFYFFLPFVHLQKSCRKIMAKHQTAKKLTVNDLASVATEEKFIKRLKEQQHDKQEAEENRKTLHKCLHKILSRKHRTHQQLNEVVQEEVRYFENIFISRTLVLTKFPLFFSSTEPPGCLCWIRDLR